MPAHNGHRLFDRSLLSSAYAGCVVSKVWTVSLYLCWVINLDWRHGSTRPTKPMFDFEELDDIEEAVPETTLRVGVGASTPSTQTVHEAEGASLDDNARGGVTQELADELSRRRAAIDEGIDTFENTPRDSTADFREGADSATAAATELGPVECIAVAADPEEAEASETEVAEQSRCSTALVEHEEPADSAHEISHATAVKANGEDAVRCREVVEHESSEKLLLRYDCRSLCLSYGAMASSAQASIVQKPIENVAEAIHLGHGQQADEPDVIQLDDPVPQADADDRPDAVQEEEEEEDDEDEEDEDDDEDEMPPLKLLQTATQPEMDASPEPEVASQTSSDDDEMPPLQQITQRPPTKHFTNRVSILPSGDAVEEQDQEESSDDDEMPPLQQIVRPRAHAKEPSTLWRASHDGRPKDGGDRGVNEDGEDLPALEDSDADGDVANARVTSKGSSRSRLRPKLPGLPKRDPALEASSSHVWHVWRPGDPLSDSQQDVRDTSSYGSGYRSPKPRRESTKGKGKNNWSWEESWRSGYSENNGKSSKRSGSKGKGQEPRKASEQFDSGRGGKNDRAAPSTSRWHTGSRSERMASPGERNGRTDSETSWAPSLNSDRQRPKPKTHGRHLNGGGRNPREPAEPPIGSATSAESAPMGSRRGSKLQPHWRSGLATPEADDAGRGPRVWRPRKCLFPSDATFHIPASMHPELDLDSDSPRAGLSRPLDRGPRIWHTVDSSAREPPIGSAEAGRPVTAGRMVPEPRVTGRHANNGSAAHRMLR